MALRMFLDNEAQKTFLQERLVNEHWQEFVRFDSEVRQLPFLLIRRLWVLKLMINEESGYFLYQSVSMISLFLELTDRRVSMQLRWIKQRTLHSFYNLALF